MSKVTYIIKASEDSLNEKTAAILIQIAKKNFITSSELREVLAETLSGSSVNSNIGVLIKKGFIEKSGDGLVITGEAQDIISKAATIYAEENKPELLKERKTRSARGVTDDMEKDIEFIKEIIKDKFEIKTVETNRSNMGVVLEKRLSNGIRKFEVMRNGIFRIFGYKVSKDILDILESKGMTYRIASNGNAYIDIKRTQEVMKDIIESI